METRTGERSNPLQRANSPIYQLTHLPIYRFTDSQRAHSASPSEHRQNEREDDTQDDRRREREIEGEVVAFDGDVAGQPPERQAEHDEQADARDRKAAEDERFPHVSSLSPHAGLTQFSSIPAKK